MCTIIEAGTKSEWKTNLPLSLMSGSSHIRSVLVGVEYRNCRRTFVVYLLFAIWMGQIQSKFVTYGLASL